MLDSNIPSTLRGEICITGDGAIEITAQSQLVQVALARRIQELGHLKDQEREDERRIGREEALKIITRNVLEELSK